MGISVDFLPFLMAMGIGLFVIFVGVWHVEGRRIGRVRLPARLSRLSTVGRKGSPEWGAAFSSASDFKSALECLTPEVQLEVAEHLLGEGDPFLADSLEVVRRVALGSDVELRRRAMGLLGSSSISPVAKVSLAERVLDESFDDVVKIDGIRAIVKLVESGVQLTHPLLIDSIISAVASRLGDRSEKVRIVAREEFSEAGALHDFVPAIDERLAICLGDAKGRGLDDLMVFISRHESLLPRASLAARRRELRA